MRLFDIVFSIVGLILFLPFGLLLLIIGIFDTGSPLFIQQRVGKFKQPFSLVKFRTMRKDTASVATHLVNANSKTKFGSFLRKTKLDEVPQLWNVLLGEMSMVGPRPNLFNQEELIQERDSRGVYEVRPGITGLAQINEIDMSTPKLLAETDAEMIQTLTFQKYFKYLFLTVLGKGQGDRVKNNS